MVAPGPPDDLVIDISHIHDIQNAIPKVVLQYASDYVKCDIVSCVAHMCAVIYGRSTFIPCQLLAAGPSSWYQWDFAV